MSKYKSIISSFFIFVLNLMLFFVGINGNAQNESIPLDAELEERAINRVDVLYYENTKQPQRKTSNSLESSYDRKGIVLGELQLKYDNGSRIPWDGERFVFDIYDGSVSDIISYHNGTLVKRTNFRKRLVSKGHYKTFKEVVDYAADGYHKIKRTSFYSYDKKQSEVFYKEGVASTGRFFDKNGNEIGVYDFEKKNGTRYVFFSDSDNVKLMEIYRDSTLVNSKLFIQSENSIYSRIQPILVYELNVDCCERFYSDEGQLLGELTYRFRKPWEGIAHDRNERTKYTFKEGLRNGSYEKQNDQEGILEEGQFKDDLKEGLFKYYQYSGALQKTEMYANGVLNGTAIYYDKNGQEVSRMIYQNGKKSDGTLVSRGYSGKYQNQQTIEGGIVTSKTFYTKKGKTVTTYKDGLELETTLFYKDSDQKKLTYRIRNSALDGEVIRYDENGAEQHSAKLSNGKLVSGTLLLSSNNPKAKVRNLKMIKTDDKFTIVIFDADGTISFKAEETLSKDANSNYVGRLNENLKFISYYRLY